MFPEFKPFFKGSLKSSSAMYILENYGSPSKISNMTKDSYAKMSSKLRRTLSYADFLRLKELAKNTIGREDNILIIELEVYLDLFKELDSKIKRIESLILEEYKSVNSYIHTIPRYWSY